MPPSTRLGLLAAFAVSTGLSAQISTAIVEQHKNDFHTQVTDADMKREGGTQPRDWDYSLPDGVTTHQITFYVDGGTPLYAKMFFPKGFKTTERRPAIVVGHGINALSIGIEKYAARFADRGFVAMAIDYQSYGFSSSGSDDLRLLEPDPTTDAQAVTEKRLRLVVKRTNLDNAHEVDDYRAAISYVQGEPGVDPDRIGIWGSSNSGSVVISVAEIDTRAKAVVSQVAGPRPSPRGPAPVPGGQAAVMVDDAIKRARVGQGAEVDGGFSFKSKIDLFGNFRNRDVRPGSQLDQIGETTKILFLPAEHDELIGPPTGAQEATKYLSGRGITAQTIVYPELTHFQVYSNTGFEVGSTLAADWFEKYLGPPKTITPTTAGQAVRR
ncbi:MAG: dienelactone hydrolase family protein [Acidobacteriia bacterium]|nr:dienelactone hydrolase family protein [Terriglobia bacterium]